VVSDGFWLITLSTGIVSLLSVVIVPIVRSAAIIAASALDCDKFTTEGTATTFGIIVIIIVSGRLSVKPSLTINSSS